MVVEQFTIQNSIQQYGLFEALGLNQEQAMMFDFIANNFEFIKTNTFTFDQMNAKLDQDTIANLLIKSGHSSVTLNG